jgi:xanthine dehydrogenase molybdopterin binding subunit/xanthine dehydrogenase small subunit
MEGSFGGAFSFQLNGERVDVQDAPTHTTLLDWLRHHRFTGTKCGCNEGDCGACTVALLDTDAAGRPVWRAVNSCIALLPMFAGRELVTVEGVARPGEDLHPVQAAMVKHYGSQCGYCTPGFIMSMFEGYYRDDLRASWQIADQLCGNLCRCTGYRPIRDAAKEVFLCPGRDARCPGAADCPTDPHAGRLQSAAPALEPLRYTSGQEFFLRPTSLAELLALVRHEPEARLIAGGTEIGVEINKQQLRCPRLVSTEAVPELRAIRETDAAWHLGASAPLTAIEEALDGAFPSLGKMLWLFGFRQLRNRATLGGSLATASPIGDAAPVLLSLDASLLLVSEEHGERTVPLYEFFIGYRRSVLRPGEIIQAVILPKPGQGGGAPKTEFYKVSKRREMDISAVSAAFHITLDAQDRVTSARIAFGGVAATPARAPQAEAALLGRTLAAAREDVAAALAQDYSPITDRRGSAAYRHGVIAGLWDKFARGESGPQDARADFDSPAEWEVESPSRALPHESGAGHVTGRAQYVDDVAQNRPMLDLWPVCAPHAHAKILRRDIRRALAVPGVRAVLLAEDIPGENNVGVSRQDETLLAQEEVLYHQHLVAVVVGDTPEICREGARLVEVDYAPRPAILSLPEAIAAASFHTEPNYMRRGDWRTGLAASLHQLEGEFELGGQEHFYLETQAAWAEIDGDGNVFVSSSTQHPSEIQNIVAEVLHLPRQRVVVQAPRMGGGFGGKETQGNTWAALAALAALKTGRPVRVQTDRDVDMRLTGKRHPFLAKFQAGYDDDGHLLALQCALVSNGGWSLDLSIPVTDRAMFHIDNAYYIPHLEVSGRVAKTHVTSQTAFRGFGGPQGMLVIEEIMDRIARRLGLRPEDVRERNFYHARGETNTTHYGQEIGDFRLPALWRQLKQTAGFDARRAEIAHWNESHVRIKRGLAITPVKFGISFTYTSYNQAGALVLLYRDGTAQVNHGGTEMGQGLHTKILGVAIRELGLPAERIRVMITATDKVPNTSATAASSGSDLNGAAVQDACRQLRARLLPFAVTMLRERFGGNVAPEHVRVESGAVFVAGKPDEAVEFMEVVDRAFMERVSLAAQGYYRTPNLHWDRALGRGRPFHYFACGAAVSEVEVDGTTGMFQVRRADILHDVGRSLNPGVDRGQIEGGYVQGLGWLTCEDLRWDAAGRLLTHGASTYQIPAISDAPADFRVALFEDSAAEEVVGGSKAVGEPPLMLAISVREAIRDAVAAFGHPPGEIALPSPATNEAIFMAINGQPPA